MGYHDDFISGEGAQYWRLGPGWQVVAAPNAGLQGVGTDAVGIAHRARSETWARSYVFSARLLWSAGEFRMLARAGYQGRYLLRCTADELILEREGGDAPIRLLAQPLPRQLHQHDAWHDVSISSRTDGRIEIEIDGQDIGAASDPDPLGSGGIGFELTPGSKLTVREVTVGFGALPHKQKTPVEKKLADLCAQTPAPSKSVAMLFHLLDRWRTGVQPQGFEQDLFSFLDGLSRSERTALQSAVATYQQLPAHLAACLVDQPTVAALQGVTIDLKGLANAFLADIAAHGLSLTADTLVCRPGKVRPWSRMVGIESPAALVTGPWPRVTSVNGIRTADQSPPVPIYQPQEYDQVVTVDAAGNISYSVKNWPNCSLHNGPASSGLCLHVPRARQGSDVELVGLNFCADKVKVRLVPLDQTGSPSTITSFEVEAKVCGDEKTPVTVVDSSVRDRATFTLPLPTQPNAIPVATYRVSVIVPNVNGLTTSDGNQPADFQTVGAIFLKVAAPSGTKFNVSLRKAKCYEETHGEWASDEVRIFASVATGDSATLTAGAPLQMPDVMGDVDGGNVFDIYWNLLGTPMTGSEVPSVAVIVLKGWEVDSEDALTEQVKSFGDAFTKFMGWVWDKLKGVVSSAGSALMALGGKVAAIVGGIAAVFLLGIGLIYAAWAPPDLIMTDVFVLTEDGLVDLTDATMPRPAASTATYEDITVSILPESKGVEPYLYVEERQYRSKNEESNYGLWFHYRRTPS